MRTSVVILVCLLFLLGPAAAEDEKKQPQKAPPKPLTTEQAADAVLKAVQAKDDKALKALAEKDKPDPWLVADELCYRGEHDAAGAFSRAAPRVDTEKLPAYTEAWRQRGPDKAERELLVAMNAAIRARQPQRVVEGTASLAPTPDTVVRVRLRHTRGMALRSPGRREESHAVLQEGANAALALGWLARASKLYHEAGLSAYRAGALPRVLASWEQGLALASRRGDEKGAARTLGNIGVVHDALGDYLKALSIHEKALEAKRAIGDKHGAAATLGSIGNVHANLGDYPRALAILGQALAEKKALGDKRGAAQTLVNMGIVHADLGDNQKALSIFEQGLEAMEALGNERDVATVRMNIGTSHQSLGDLPKALSTFEQALQEQRALGDTPGAARTLANIGSVCAELGDYSRARSVLEQALEEMKALGDRYGVAKVLGNIGWVRESLGDYASALTAYEQALAEQKALGDKHGAARTLGYMATAHAELGDTARARRLLEKSARAAKSLRATALFVESQTVLARLHLDTGKSARALGAAQKALTATEKLLGGLGQEQGALAREQHASLYAVGALAAVREEDSAEALTFLESGRAGALLDALGEREALRWKAESLPPDLLKAEREAQAAQNVARHHCDRALKRGTLKERRRAAVALDDASDVVREVAGRIQRELKQQANLFYPRAKTIEEVEEALEENQALVLYGLCLGEALALVLRPDGERVVSLGKLADVTAACEALEASDPRVDPTAALENLRKLLIEPLKLSKDVQQVLLSPEGPLCYVPFGALFEQTVAMTPSGTTHVLLLDEERAKGQGILALGDPDYAGVSKGAQAIYYGGRGLSRLPATRKEVQAIGTQTLLGAKASEAGLREVLPNAKRWRAVHFACHGLVDIDRPMLSSLALSRAGNDDGFLTALEILRTKIPADLAVLSACETGKGKIVKGEGIVGLTRAFMFAGAPRVICSLWKVDDEATQALMVKFYELWNPKEGKKGLGAAVALKKAQAFIKGQEKWKHPYFWAAWVLWGLPD